MSETNNQEFLIIYQKYKLRLFNYAFKMLNDRETAQDVVQNVFLKLFQNFNRIQKQESILSWLYISARNDIFTYWSKSKRISYTIDAGDEETIDSNNSSIADIEYETLEFKTILEKCLEKLKPHNKEIFLLREYSGLAYSEIAEIINSDAETVKSRLFKTRKKLFSLIKERYNEGRNEL